MYSTRAILTENIELGVCIDWCHDIVGPGNYAFGWSPVQDDYIFHFENEPDLIAFKLRFKI